MPLSNAQLLYIFDPLCSWCYGMTPVVQQLAERYAGRFPVAVLSGGMVTGADAGPLPESWPHLQQAQKQIEQVTGVRFGEAYRQLSAAGTYRYDSEPPSRALMTFRQLDEQEREVAFAHDIQRAYFEQGQDLNEPGTYNTLLAAYGIDATEFWTLFDSPEARQATQHEFEAVRQMGVQGFPTLIFAHGHQGYVLARGYQPFGQLQAGLEQLLRDAAQQS